MRIALAQVDPTVGDIAGNVRLVIDWIERARNAEADLVAFPEMVVSGYPPEDLLQRDHFVEQCQEGVAEIARAGRGLVVVVGAPLRARAQVPGASGPRVANAAVMIDDGTVAAVYEKIRLPNYAVFDEERYFLPGNSVIVCEWGGRRFSVNVCEDIWQPVGPTEEAALRGGAELVVNISMSPYHMGKGAEREAMIRRRALDSGAYVAYVNGVGGQDELVFDGHSVVFDPEGGLLSRGAQFEEELLVVDLPLGVGSRAAAQGSAPGTYRLENVSLRPRAGASDYPPLPATETGPAQPALPREAEVYGALCLGVRDYVRKNGFTGVVIGLSGGIDSALTACVAVDALGREAVTGVTMPSRYSSDGTRSDAEELAARLGIRFMELPIETVFSAYLETLGGVFEGRAPDSTEENIQARIRGNLLMALSNKFGWMVLTTGNKSEMAVGYATLYGDMAGGYAAIKDVPKTLVYELARYRNSLGPGEGPIPSDTITRAPSAELRPDQTDQDTLPPYEVLDRIIEAYVVRQESVGDMVAGGLDRAVVERVVGMIEGNEYKRRQAPPGVRITSRAFGKDRRLPITNRYRG